MIDTPDQSKKKRLGKSKFETVFASPHLRVSGEDDGLAGGSLSAAAMAVHANGEIAARVDAKVKVAGYVRVKHKLQHTPQLVVEEDVLKKCHLYAYTKTAQYLLIQKNLISLFLPTLGDFTLFSR